MLKRTAIRSPTTRTNYVVPSDVYFCIIRTARMASWLTAALLLVFFLSLTTLFSENSIFFATKTTTVPSPETPGLIRVRHGAVAADDARCSRIGRDVLKRGGHAVDAAVAAAFCLVVISPAASGVGGGGFIILGDAKGKALAIDMREAAPGFSTEDMYHGNLSRKELGPLTVAVPGFLRGIHKAWTLYGRIPWKSLIHPAEQFARHGFVISKNVHDQIRMVEKEILNDEGLSSLYAPNGELLKPGQICKNVKLADTLHKIGIHGVDIFYNGSIGESFVEDVQKAGGYLTMDDMRRYEAKVKEPISLDVFGFKLLGVPPPAAGPATMFLVLNILAQYKSSEQISEILKVHRRVEAIKHGFAVRMNLGDPDFVNITDVLHDMLSPKFAAELHETINDNMTFDPTHYGGKWDLWNPPPEHGTTHLCVVDKDRNSIGVTLSINEPLGACFISPSTGIVLNNEMEDFSIPFNSSLRNCTIFSNSACACSVNCTCCGDPPPAKANFIRPAKRPLSSIAPIIVLEGGRLKAVLGGSGGSKITGATIEVFLNHFVDGMDPFSAVSAPRYFHPLIPNKVQYENWTTVYDETYLLPEKIREGLEARGHKLTTTRNAVVQLILEDFNARNGDGMLVAVTDPRYHSTPAGY